VLSLLKRCFFDPCALGSHLDVLSDTLIGFEAPAFDATRRWKAV
jgi:hypothetical protein